MRSKKNDNENSNVRPCFALVCGTRNELVSDRSYRVIAFARSIGSELALQSPFNPPRAPMGIVIILASDVDSPAGGCAFDAGHRGGTRADRLLASIGRSVDAFRTAIFHLLFNTITVGIGLLFANQLAAAGQWLAFGSDNVGRQNRERPRAFNVAGALAFVGLVPMVAKILTRLIPDRRSRGETLTEGQAAH